MKRGHKIAMLLSVFAIIIVAIVFINNDSSRQDKMDISLPSAYKVTDDGTDDGYKRPAKPVAEWTNKELAENTAYHKKMMVEDEKRRLKVMKMKADMDKRIADFEQNREKRREAFRKLSPEEMEAALAEQFNSLDPEYQRLVREQMENFDLEAVIASSPEIQEMRKKSEEEARQLDAIIAETKKFHEKVKNRVTSLLYEAEEKGAILIYDENGRPVGYEKDEYGDPILIPVDEDTPPSDTSPDVSPQQQDRANLQTQEGSDPVALEPSSLVDRVTDLWIKSYEEYPETVLVQMLSKEEYNTFFQDEDSKKWLSSRQQQMQKDVVSAVRKMLSSTSSEKDIEIVKKNITRFWDKDFAETIIQQVKKDRE